MLRSKSIISLIKPMSQLHIFKVPISSHSHTTTTQDHFNDQTTKQYTQKNTEASRNFQRSHNTSKNNKISTLVTKILDLVDTKEAVYGALDAWVAEEHEFPIGRLKTALLTLEKKQQWHKIIQVIKWMLSKGQGVTVGTYGQLIRALDMDNRVEEANKLWVKKMGRDVQSVPWKVCEIMISVYYRNEKWEELVKFFKGLEACGRKPPGQIVVKKIAESYGKLGLVEEKERVLEKYKSLFTNTRGRYGRKPVKELSKSAVMKISS